MLVGPDGTAVGSVSGGCVEGAVYELAGEVVETGEPVVQRYGVSDDDAFAVGLTCGGIIELLVEPGRPDDVPGARPRSPRRSSARDPVAVVSRSSRARRTSIGRRLVVLAGPPCPGRSGRDRLDDAATDDARGLLAAGRTDTLHYGLDGERRGDGPDAVRRLLRPAGPDDRLRRHRLRRGRGPHRRVPRLPRHRLRRPAGVRHVEAVPRRRRGRRRLAAPLPAGRDRRRPGRRAHRGVRAHPRPEVRRAGAARSRCASRSRTSARWAPAAPTTTGSPGCARPA